MQPQIAKIDYKPRPHALAFHARSQKEAVMVWHRRAGKTVACVADLLEKAIRCPLPMPQYSYVAPTYRQAKKIAWRYLKNMGAPIITKVMESELTVELVNGALISLYGADNPDSLRGLYHDGVIIDEFGDISPTLYSEIIAPAVADRDGWVVFIGTPRGPNHFYEIWKEAKGRQDWFTSMLRASTSGVFTAARLQKIRNQPGMDPDTFDQEFECDFQAANKGAFYARQLNELDAAGHMGLFPWDPSLPVVTGWDIGYSDDTSIWFAQMHGADIHVIDFWTGSGYSVKDVMEDVLQTKPYTYEPFYLPHDAKNKNFQTGKSVREIMWEEYRAKSIIVPQLSRQDGIQAVRTTLGNVYFNTVGCDALRKEGIPALVMYQRQYDTLKKVFKKDPLHDWASNPADGFRYLCLGINPFTAKSSSKPLATHAPSSQNNVLNLDSLFADRESARPSGRI